VSVSVCFGWVCACVRVCVCEREREWQKAIKVKHYLNVLIVELLSNQIENLSIHIPGPYFIKLISAVINAAV
jgi:hypothetical protein